MQLFKPSTFGEFRHLTESFLLAHEAEHGLMYGIASTPAPPDGYSAVVTVDGQLVAAAIRNIGKMVVSREEARGAIALIAADAIHDPAMHGILGPPDSLEKFAAATRREWRRGRGLTIYQCDRVIRPNGVFGQRHIAMAADHALLARWVRDFNAEALGDSVTSDVAAQAADRYIANGTMHLWLVDRTPVACAAAVAPTPHAIRIGPVYTPPENRRLGYGSALVADLAQDQLDRGRAFTYLYADRDNETSNSIYQKIGYRVVADCDELWLA